MTLAQIAYQWMDLVWVPIALLSVERGKRFLTLGFVGLCMLALRLQVELFESLGYPQGYLGLMDSSLFPRGVVTYGIFIAFFLLLARFSKGADRNVYMAASISILIAAFCVSSFVMVL